MEDSIVLTEDSAINDSGENTATDNDAMIDLLRQSPFGALLNIDGVTPESLISSFANAFGNSDSSIDPSLFDGSVPGSNPFSGFGNPTAEASPLTGGINPWAEIDIDSSSTGGGMGGGMPSFGDDDSSVLIEDSTGGENTATNDETVSADGSIPNSDMFVDFGDPTAEGSPLTGGVNPWAVINIDSEDLNGGDSLTGGSSDSTGSGMPDFSFGSRGVGDDSSSGGFGGFGGGGFGSGDDSSSGGFGGFGSSSFGGGDDSSDGGFGGMSGGGFGGGGGMGGGR